MNSNLNDGTYDRIMALSVEKSGLFEVLSYVTEQQKTYSPNNDTYFIAERMIQVLNEAISVHEIQSKLPERSAKKPVESSELLSYYFSKILTF